MKKPKLGLPPTAPISTAMSNPAMQAMINKGGSVLEEPIPIAKKPEEAEDKLKSFTFKIYESELALGRGQGEHQVLRFPFVGAGDAKGMFVIRGGSEVGRLSTESVAHG